MASNTKEQLLTPMNPVFESSFAYLHSLKNKIRLILGKKWQIHTKFQNKGTIFHIKIVLVCPEGLILSSRIELMKYCQIKGIDTKKIKHIHFQFLDEIPNRSHAKSRKPYLVQTIDRPMQRALKGLKAKRWIESTLKFCKRWKLQGTQR